MSQKPSDVSDVDPHAIVLRDIPKQYGGWDE
jgi:hypothetical protein